MNHNSFYLHSIKFKDSIMSDMNFINMIYIIYINMIYIKLIDTKKTIGIRSNWGLMANL